MSSAPASTRGSEPEIATEPSIASVGPSAVREVRPVGEVRGWSGARRAGFRLVLAYAALYLAPFPLDAVSWTAPLTDRWTDLWHAVVPWVGAHVLHVAKPITVFTNGSGDTTYDYVLVLCFAALAACAAAAWSIADRRTPYARLDEWLRVALRYSLAAAMLGYGCAKVLKSQFPFPGPERMIEPVGELSPMGLLWTFMGYSTPYNVFTGGAECLGGLLLFFRRTTTLGALVVVAVMSNVVMLNFCYDVPVKLYSSHLLAIAVYLAAPDLPRLFAALVLQRPTCPPSFAPHFTRVPWRRAALAAKIGFVGLTAFTMVTGAYENMRKWGDDAPHGPLYGAWEVESFDAPATTTRWTRVAFNDAKRVGIQRADQSMRRYWAEIDAEKRTMTIEAGKGEPKVAIAYALVDSDHLTLTAPSFDGARVEAHLRRLPPASTVLATRGFHWINEYPFNN